MSFCRGCIPESGLPIGESIFARATRGGCHDSSYGNTDASTIPTGVQPVSWKMSAQENRVELALPYASDGLYLIKMLYQ